MTDETEPTPVDEALAALAAYDDLIAHRDVLFLQQAEQIAAVIPQEVQEDIDAIKAETTPKIATIMQKIEAMKGLAEEAFCSISAPKVHGQRRK